MALPETIAVRYTEDEAGYVSVRPVVRQTFRMMELLDLLLAVAGKDAARLHKMLSSGTAAFHGHRYWWEGFAPDAAELAAALAAFPDADPSRPFRAEDCCSVTLEVTHPVPRLLAEWKKEDAVRRRLLRRRSVWDALLHLARTQPPAYRDYSYEKRADAYVRELAPAEREELCRQTAGLATRRLAAAARLARQATRLVYLSPRRQG
jgi:hypothetical protein